MTKEPVDLTKWHNTTPDDVIAGFKQAREEMTKPYTRRPFVEVVIPKEFASRMEAEA